MIVRQTYELIKKRLGKKLEEITVSEVRIGLYMSAVRLSDDSVGTSATFHPIIHSVPGTTGISDYSRLQR